MRERLRKSFEHLKGSKVGAIRLSMWSYCTVSVVVPVDVIDPEEPVTVTV